MSKFIEVTLVGQTDQMLVNVDQIKEVEINAEGSSILVKDGYYLIVSEEIEQIEAQLLRDEFAKSALNGLLSNPGGVIQKSPLSGTHYINGNHESVTEWAYELADAMLKERRK